MQYTFFGYRQNVMCSYLWRPPHAWRLPGDGSSATQTQANVTNPIAMDPECQILAIGLGPRGSQQVRGPHHRAPEGPSTSRGAQRPQQAPEGPKGPQKAPGGPSRLQSDTPSPRGPQRASAGPRRPQRAPARRPPAGLPEALLRPPAGLLWPPAASYARTYVSRVTLCLDYY